MINLINCHLTTLFVLLSFLSEFFTEGYDNNSESRSLPRSRRQVNERKDEKIGDEIANEYVDEVDGDGPLPDDETDEDDFGSRFWRGELINNPEIDSPFAASVFKNGDQEGGTRSIYKCAGSFIHPRVVLTVAHCFSQPLDKRGYYVRYYLKNLRERGERILSSDVILHDSFESANRRAWAYDVALIILESDAARMELSRILSLPYRSEEMTYVSDGGRHKLTVVGAGPSYSLEPGLNLKEHDAYLYKSICSRIIGSFFNPRYQLCTDPADGFITCTGIVCIPL